MRCCERLSLFLFFFLYELVCSAFFFVYYIFLGRLFGRMACSLGDVSAVLAAAGFILFYFIFHLVFWVQGRGRSF